MKEKKRKKKLQQVHPLNFFLIFYVKYFKILQNTLFLYSNIYVVITFYCVLCKVNADILHIA